MTVYLLSYSVDSSTYPYFHLSTAFTTICSQYCSADHVGLLVHPLVNCFPVGLRAVLLREWQQITHSSAR